MMYAGRLPCIVGPTASGKSAVAERVADLVSGEVVSVDAMQVYRGMNIGTAKIPPCRRRHPLHMVDVCPVTENYSVERFQADARSCIDDLCAAGIIPVLCGGTGLYLNAVIDEMDFAPGYRGDERRAAYEELACRAGADHLHALLAERDPESAAAIHPHNTRRVIRALELCDEGISYADSLRTLHKRAPHYQTLIFGLDLPRELLYERIDRRVDGMFSLGLVEEVVRMRGEGLSPATTAGQAIGYKEMLEALDGLITLDEARAAIKSATRRYAKRQISWFRHDGRVRWIDMGTHDTEAAARLIASERMNGAF